MALLWIVIGVAAAAFLVFARRGRGAAITEQVHRQMAQARAQNSVTDPFAVLPHPPKAIIPTGSEAAVAEMKLSPGVVLGDHVFLTGMTGSGPEGMPEDPEAQFRAAFDKIDAVLSEAGLGFSAIVEMTSYHVGLQGHLDLFRAVRADYVVEPYPAWTAVEVAGLHRKGALVEIRVIARGGQTR